MAGVDGGTRAPNFAHPPHPPSTSSLGRSLPGMRERTVTNGLIMSFLDVSSDAKAFCHKHAGLFL